MKRLFCILLVSFLFVPLLIQTANAASVPQPTSSKEVVKDVGSIAKQFGSVAYIPSDMTVNNAIPWVDQGSGYWYLIHPRYWFSTFLSDVVDASGTVQVRTNFSVDTMRFINQIDDRMHALGFALISQSSSKDFSSGPFFDFIHTYQNHQFVCALLLNPEDSMQVPVVFSCGSSLTTDMRIQKPLLQALKTKGQFVSITKRVGSFVRVIVTSGRSGSYAILKKHQNGAYTNIYMGQEAPPCSTLVRYAIPRSLLDHDTNSSVGCYKKNGTMGTY